MAANLDRIQQQAQELTASERAKLAEAMLESIQQPLAHIDAAWNLEIEARVAAFDRGDMPAYAAEDVFAEARRLAR
ncbi:MAG TPA: addiction module protein [Rhodanobacteraceae bacterium]|nr:addiction module protein [Rhodanobacteraceae bacterium]